MRLAEAGHRGQIRACEGVSRRSKIVPRSSLVSRTSVRLRSRAMILAALVLGSCHSGPPSAAGISEHRLAAAAALGQQMSLSPELESYLADVLESQDVRRIGRYIAAVEPSEQRDDLNPSRHKASAKKNWS